MKTVEERLRGYEPLWENWTYTGEFLGEGAMSSVFEIQSTAMGLKEVAALKIITVKKDMSGEVKIPPNALNEIKILRDLSGCANIVHYHDSTQRKIYDENGNLEAIDILIKMEKLKSLSEGDKLSEDQIVKLGKDMCNALIHASEHKIIHRDIKPQNIFTDSDGNYKLGDFGVAKIVSAFSRMFTMNIGTLAYSAPEVCQSPTGTYDISSDIYSLGLVLYVFLNNGFLPFFNSSASLHAAIEKRISGAPFPSPANGSKNLKAIVMRACSNDLAKRYRTPREMLDDFELLSTGGKKMVIDPFATLDANIDIEETPAEVETTSSSGRLKMNIKRSDSDTPVKRDVVKEEKPKELISSSSTSRIRTTMNSSAKSSTPASTDPTLPEEKKEMKSESRLRINLSAKTPTNEESAIKPESEDKKSEEKPFFSTPDSL